MESGWERERIRQEKDGCQLSLLDGREPFRSDLDFVPSRTKLPESDATSFQLTWSQHSSHLLTSLECLLGQEAFSDVTLLCQGHEQEWLTYPAHKIVLSAGSPYFEAILRETDHPSMECTLFLEGYTQWEVKSCLEFMYTGRLDGLGGGQAEELLETATSLQITGLEEVLRVKLRERRFHPKNLGQQFAPHYNPDKSATKPMTGEDKLDPGTITSPKISRLSQPPRRKQARPRRRSGEYSPKDRASSNSSSSSSPRYLDRNLDPEFKGQNLVQAPPSLCSRNDLGQGQGQPPPRRRGRPRRNLPVLNKDQNQGLVRYGESSQESTTLPAILPSGGCGPSLLPFLTSPPHLNHAHTPPVPNTLPNSSPSSSDSFSSSQNIPSSQIPEKNSSLPESGQSPTWPPMFGHHRAQHSAPRGGPPRAWSNLDLTRALQNVWNKNMTTSQASRVFSIPYNSLLMYVRGKYGKSLKLDLLKKGVEEALEGNPKGGHNFQGVKAPNSGQKGKNSSLGGVEQNRNGHTHQQSLEGGGNLAGGFHPFFEDFFASHSFPWVVGPSLVLPPSEMVGNGAHPHFHLKEKVKGVHPDMD